MAKLLFTLWIVVLLIGFSVVAVVGSKLMDGADLNDMSVLLGLLIVVACALIAPMLKRGYDLKKPIEETPNPKESS